METDAAKTTLAKTMPTPEDAKRRAAFAYNAAADVFDDPALGFWDYFGRKTVEKLHLHQGARVLDVCCGAGASALPAAESVGPFCAWG